MLWPTPTREYSWLPLKKMLSAPFTDKETEAQRGYVTWQKLPFVLLLWRTYSLITSPLCYILCTSCTCVCMSVYACMCTCALQEDRTPDLSTRQARSELSGSHWNWQIKFSSINSVCVAGAVSLNSFVQMKITLNSFRFVITPYSSFRVTFGKDSVWN